MLELAILGLLKERTMHGYQLQKRLVETLGAFYRASYGSLYPTLRRLQQDGAVEMVFPREDVGRKKNVYRITERGEQRFRELLEEAGPEAGDESVRFQVKLAFFRYLKPETRIGMLERRRAAVDGRLAELKRSFTNYRERLDDYTLALMRHGVDAAEHDLRFIDDLIKDERRRVARPRRARRATAARPARRPAPIPQKERAG